MPKPLWFLWMVFIRSPHSLLNSLNMTQINAGVSFKGRLPQIVGQAALAASVFAGGASL